MSVIPSDGDRPEKNMSILEKSVEALHLDNNNDSGSTSCSKDSLGFARPPVGRVSSLEDVIEEDHHGGPTSPLRNRVGRSPRRRLEEEQYIYSVAQSNLTRLRNRRRSDPGRISVSPLRTRLRIESNISEDGDYENRNISLSATRLPVRRASSLDPSEIDEAVPVMYGIRSRSRSPHTQVKLRTQRSRSLPGIEFELGEAIGALAVRHSALTSDTSKASGIPPRRRRSVSVEAPAPLEAILEENAAGQKSSRRFSTPSVKSPSAL